MTSRLPKTGLAILALVLGSAVLAGVMYQRYYPQEVLRHIVTVVIDTPVGQSAGSSVIETMIGEEPKIFPQSDYIYSDVEGEAVTVRLPDGQLLFALLSAQDGNGADSYQLDLMRDAVASDPDLLRQLGAELIDDWRRFRPLARKRELKAILQPEDYPMLVTFSDLDDPTSVELVDPDDLAATFGEGISLQYMMVASTKARPTRGIEQTLPWLEKVGRQRATLKPNPPRLLKDSTPIDLVTPSDFSTELYR